MFRGYKRSSGKKELQYRQVLFSLLCVVTCVFCNGNGRSLEIPSGRGVLEAKSLEAKCEAKLEFPGGMGVQNKKPFVGGVWVFSGTACCVMLQ